MIYRVICPASLSKMINLKDEMESDDLTESGSEFQTEQVFGTTEYKYENG